MLTINDLSVSKELDVSGMSAVHGGEYRTVSAVVHLDEFVAAVNRGDLNNPVDLIRVAGMVVP